VAGELARLSEADIAVVLRYETDGTATVLGGWRGAGMPAVTGRRLAVDGEGVAESVLRTGRPARDTRFAGAPGSMTDWLRRAFMRAATGSPVIAGGRLWGVLITATTRPGQLGEHRLGRHGERHVPGHQRQVAEQSGEDLAIARLRHQGHQHHSPQRRRHRHRPARRPLDLPLWPRLRRHLVDRARLPGHLIELLLDDAEPGVISRVTAGLHLPVPADHRRRDRRRLAEHH
jgi:GAF domain-containing protein